MQKFNSNIQPSYEYSSNSSHKIGQGKNKQTNRRTNRDYYPALSYNKIFSISVNLLILQFLNIAKNIPVVLQSSPIKIWGKSVKGFLTYDETYKETNSDSTLNIQKDRK